MLAFASNLLYEDPDAVFNPDNRYRQVGFSEVKGIGDWQWQVRMEGLPVLLHAERKAQDCTLFIIRQTRSLGSKPKGRNKPTMRSR
jgi:hypothetical protein